MIGGNILTEYTAQLVERIGSSSGERLSEYASSPTILGGPVQTGSLVNIYTSCFN